MTTTTMRATTTTTTTTRATSTARGRRADSWRTASTSVARESARPRPRTRATERDDATTTSRLRTLLARSKNRGVDADEDARREIERAIDALADVTEDAPRNERRSNGRWRLEYTTEKETRFLLGLEPASTRAYQTIDGDARRLRNEVMYQRGNTEIVFTVDASIETVSEKRVRFAFTSASIRFGDFFRVPIPPVGEGWFENVYVDEDIRVSRDSRGDTLVCVRDDVQRDANE
jgi:hypothetical protein